VREWRCVREAFRDDDASRRIVTEDHARDDSVNECARDDSAIESALALVRAWRVRGRVPLAVDAHATLIELERAEASGAVRAAVVRDARALALCRLVNGVVDPAQRGRYAAPVAVLAQRANIPRMLVDLRHEATHGVMPSDGALRRGVAAARAWCERWYWREQARAYEEHEGRIRRCVGELCACERWGRALSARSAGAASPSSSDDEDEDEDAAEDEGTAEREADAPSDFKGVRERRRAALGTLTSACPRGSAHVIAEALLEGGSSSKSARGRWLRVVADDDEDADDEREGVFRASDWRPTLTRLCQKWPNLFGTILDDIAARMNPSLELELRVTLDVAGSGELETTTFQSACRRALSRRGERDWSDDATSSKQLAKALQKLAGVSKDETAKTSSAPRRSTTDSLDDAAADVEALRESLRTGRKRKRESRWSKVDNWSSAPIGIVPGASTRDFATCVIAPNAVHVCANSAQTVDGAGIRRVDDSMDTWTVDEDEMRDADADVDLDRPRAETDVSAALNVSGARVELSKTAREFVAKNVSCLL